MSDDHFLSRWSRLKTASKAPAAPAEPTPEARKASPQPAVAPPAATPPAETAPQPLPPVESLTPESDFAGFMREGIDPSLRRQALKTLFSDPRFNVMDGLDVYIDDYSQPDPLPEGWLEKMTQTARLGAYREPDEKAPEPPVGDEAAGEGGAEAVSQQEQGLVEAPAAAGEAAPETDGENAGPAAQP